MIQKKSFKSYFLVVILTIYLKLNYIPSIKLEIFMKKPSTFISPKAYTENNKQRQLKLNITMFLLTQEGLKNQYWSIRSVNYNHINQKLKIGITTTNGKYGTTLTALRKVAKPLADYLYEQGLTLRRVRVNYFIDTNDEYIQKIYDTLDRVSD
jgi:hypothetical protein